MSELIRVDMGSGEVKTGELGDLSNFGGRGLTSAIVSKEVPATTHALGANNKLVFAPGLLSGTSAANSGRLSVGAKSPLTGGIKESNVGGNGALKLARLGIRGLVIEGKAEAGKLFYLLIDADGVTLHPADDLKGLGNYDTVEKLKAKHGEKAGVISIGPAGEMKMGAASIAVTDTKGRPSRHAGRGGLGAVMGSKGLKAIVLDDKDGKSVSYHNKEAFKEAAGIFRDALQAHPVTKTGGGLATFGTNTLVGIINGAGAFPTRNFSEGQFEGAEKISGEELYKVIKERGGETTHSACSNCIIQCSNVFVDKDKNYVTSGLEYETVWANGANCGIDDLDSIARVDRLCDDFGLDTIEIGCAVAVAMAGGLKEFGDAKGAIELIEEVGKGTPLGRIIGNGAAMTGQAFGVEDVPVVKRQSMPAYDPRGVKGVGVTYATTPMGADHTAGYAVAANIMRIGGFVDPLKPEGQAELSRNFQVTTAVLDSMGLCTFVSFAILDNPGGLAAIHQMANALYGWEMDADDVTKYGQGVITGEIAFNRAAGFTKKDDRLPDFFKEKKLKPHDVVFDVSDDDLDGVHEY